MLDLPKFTLKIDNEYESIEFSLYRNVNILSGATGENKTNLVEKIKTVLKNKEKMKAERG